MENISLASIFDSLKKKDKAPPNLTLSSEVRTAIRNITAAPNPTLSETPFLGVEDNNQINTVYVNPNYPRKSGLKQVNPYSFQSVVDKEELSALFNQAYGEGNLQQITLLGHLHPTGEVHTPGTTYQVVPSESLLEPSTGDLDFARSFINLNPDLKIKYFGITANTPNGPCLAIWRMCDLTGIRKFRDLERTPKQVIVL